MIQYLKGDIFSSPAKVLVNTVNTDGVMGKGIALSYKKRYPEMYGIYKEACDTKTFSVGRLLLWYGLDYWVLMFPTKDHWRKMSKLEYIEAGLHTFTEKYVHYNISSIAFPKLGCGNGGLEWKDVRPLMEKYLCNLPIDIYIYLDSYPGNAATKKNRLGSEDALDFTYNGMKNVISKASMFFPIELKNNWVASWDEEKGICFSFSDQETIIVDKEKLWGVWDEICRDHIVLKTDNLISNLLYELMEQLGYLDRAQISTSSGKIISDGFQLNEGRGRKYACSD